MRKLTTEQWIEKAKAVHGDRLFDCTVYVTAKLPIQTRCAEHGIHTWSQPGKFLKSVSGCKLCAYDAMADGKRGGQAHFLGRAVETHGKRYGYPMHDYTGMRGRVTIYCQEHGAFAQIANKHVMGSGCPECTKGAGGESRRNSAATFFARSHKAHGGDSYDYAGTVYRGMSVPVEIWCLGCDQVFSQKPFIHVTGSGCPSCAPAGFDPAKPATIYYLRVGDLYKVGITNRTIKERYPIDAVVIVEAVLMATGREARELERYILEAFDEYRYRGPAVLKSGGNTELFTRDVLGLDI